MAKATDSKHKVYPSLYRKLVLTFSVLTLVLVSIFWTVIYKAEEQMEIISLHHWLDTEAKRYQRDYVFLVKKLSRQIQRSFQVIGVKGRTLHGSMVTKKQATLNTLSKMMINTSS